MKTQKTKKSFKKKALLSSLSMLMVATVAVGSATFAWFTQNPNANAEGLQMKATATKGLVIHTQSNPTAKTVASSWRHTDYLNSNASGDASKTSSIALNPVSFDLTGDELGTAYKVQAKASTAFGADAAEAVSTASGGVATGDFYQEKIYCKVNGGEASGNLKLTGITLDKVDTIEMYQSLRIAVEYYDKSEDTKTTLGVYGLAQVTNKYLVAPDPFETGVTTFDKFCEKKGTEQEPVYVLPETQKKTFTEYTAANGNLGTVDDTGDDYVTITIYLDGEDEKCFSDGISPSDMISNVSVNLTVE